MQPTAALVGFGSVDADASRSAVHRSGSFVAKDVGRGGNGGSVSSGADTSKSSITGTCLSVHDAATLSGTLKSSWTGSGLLPSQAFSRFSGSSACTGPPWWAA